MLDRAISEPSTYIVPSAVVSLVSVEISTNSAAISPMLQYYNVCPGTLFHIHSLHFRLRYIKNAPL